MATECPICMEEYKSPNLLPKVLQCGHVICVDCLKQLETRNNRISCLICRKDSIIPDGGVEKFPTVFDLLDLSMQPKCGVHKKEVIKLFCSDCNIGVCVVCLQFDHKKHRHLYLESDETRQNALTQISRSEKTIHKKIADLKKIGKIMEETLKKLEDDKNQACEKIQSELQKRVKELTDTADRETKNIENIFNKNEEKINQTKTEIQQVCNLLESKLEQIHPPVNSISLRFLESVPKLEQLERESETTVINYPGVQTTEWRRNNERIGNNILGVSRPLYIPCLNDFRFNSNIIKQNNVGYSEDRLYSGDLVWSVCVKKFDSGYLGVYVELLRKDNPTVESSRVNYNLTILNHNNSQIGFWKKIFRTSQSVKHTGTCTYKTDGISYGLTQFILWDTLVNPTQGFIDKHGIFHVKLNITVNDIVRK